uniref:F-box associated beta-propeller type 3 domain-containing protein n=1 Tax=Solanum lycopersicum TaxID=4081 RepID=K4BT36_SOLLC
MANKQFGEMQLGPGAAHLPKSIWLSKGLNGIYTILSFDMVSEQFGEMQVPDIKTAHWGALTLHVGSLAMLTSDSDQPMTSIYDVWVMKQEGNWSKVLTIQPHIDPHWPINIWDNNKMVFEIIETSQLVLYDPKIRRVTDLGFHLDPNIDGCWVFNYKESLVPIKKGNDTPEEDNAVKQIEHYFNTIPADEASS